jgi:menaquinone-dependent protoporphyrinogen IX oxidase
MKSIVIYKSISGFTQKYAQWIAQDLKADLFTSKELKGKSLIDYDTIIFGGSLHAVGINGIDALKSQLTSLKNKKVIVFAVGASPFSPEVFTEVLNKNFSDEQQANIRFFYFRGGFDYSKLDFKNKALMTLLKWKLLSSKHKTSEEAGMLAAYSKPFDEVKRQNLKELLAYAKSID